MTLCQILEDLNHLQHHHKNIKILHHEEQTVTFVDALIGGGDRHCAKNKGDEAKAVPLYMKELLTLSLGF